MALVFYVKAPPSNILRYKRPPPEAVNRLPRSQRVIFSHFQNASLFFGPLLHHLYPWSGLKWTNQDWKSPLSVIKNKKNKNSAGLQLRCRRVASKRPVPWHVWLASGVWRRAKLAHSCQSINPSVQLLDLGARLEAVNQTRQMKTLSFVNISTTLVTTKPVCPRLHPCLHSELMFKIFCLCVCAAQPVQLLQEWAKFNASIAN